MNPGPESQARGSAQPVREFQSWQWSRGPSELHLLTPTASSAKAHPELSHP